MAVRQSFENAAAGTGRRTADHTLWTRECAITCQRTGGVVAEVEAVGPLEVRGVVRLLAGRRETRG